MSVHMTRALAQILINLENQKVIFLTHFLPVFTLKYKNVAVHPDQGQVKFSPVSERHVETRNVTASVQSVKEKNTKS